MSTPTRNTKQRRVILEELTRLKTHPTATELFDIVRGQLPRISLGTVYRNLDVLVQQGTVRKLDLGGGQTRYDADQRPHHHVRCAVCNGVSDVQGTGNALDEWVMQQIDGLDPDMVLGMHLEIVGICRECCRRLPDRELARLRRHWKRI